MKKMYNMLKLLIWCFIGVFIGSSIYQYYDYKTYPDLYIWQSAPWYTGIVIRGMFTTLVVVILLILLWFMRKYK